MVTVRSNTQSSRLTVRGVAAGTRRFRSGEQRGLQNHARPGRHGGNLPHFSSSVNKFTLVKSTTRRSSFKIGCHA